MKKELTNSEQILLSMLAEKSRHGYELEQVIKERGVREWTELGFSSIYYLLSKLEHEGLINSRREQGEHGRSRKVYVITEAGCQAAHDAAAKSLVELASSRSPVLVGLANSALLPRARVIQLLQQRKEAIKEQIKAIEKVRNAQAPLPDFAAAMFDYSISQLDAESKWIERTITKTLKEQA